MLERFTSDLKVVVGRNVSLVILDRPREPKCVQKISVYVGWIYSYLNIRSPQCSSQGCHTATETHMPHAITQCYLPPGRGYIPALTPAEAGTRLSDPELT